MAVNVKMGVDLSGFKSGIQQGTQILKGLNSEMKAAEAEFKATGNAEQLMNSKTKTLNSQIQVQKGIVDQAKTALQQMTDAGVDPADKAYQSMYATMMKAQAGMYEAQAALNGLNTSAQEAATGADKLTNSVNSIGKKISLDQVISGIGSITTGLENAAKKAVELGEKLWSTIMDSARRADDTATMAEMYGIDLDTFQRMQKLVAGGLDTSVEAILTAQSKLKKGIGSGSLADELEKIGVSMETVVGSGKYGDMTVMKDSVELFWEAGQALMNMGDEFDKEATAQAIFGKSWKELVPLFNQYKSLDEYNAALEEQTVNTEETVRDLAELNDAVGKLESSWTTLKDELIGAIAPALTKGADSLSGLLDKLTEYLKSDQGQEMLTKLGDAVSKLVEDITNIDPESVVSTFGDVLDKVTSGLEWISDNAGTIKGALELIAGGFALLKVSETVLEFFKLRNGVKSLLGGGDNGGGDVTTSGGGFWTSLGNFVATNAPKAQIWSSTNGGPVLDWLTHDSPFATMFNGIESPAEWFERQKSEFEQRKESFASDWEENEIYKFFKKGAENSQLASDWTFGDEYSAEELMNLIAEKTEEAGNGDGVPIRVDPQPPVDTPEKIKEEVGVVSLDAQLVVTGITAGGKMGLTVGGMPSGGGGGGPLMYIKGYANGLPYVPSDGLYRLHKGETVTPAREAGRSFSSNLYVENMNMNGGLSADALAASIAARNQRMMSGYGS